jgi:trehalose-6-phosphate synthase
VSYYFYYFTILLFYWKLYSAANDGDIISVHDYHLILLPQMLRQTIKKKVKLELNSTVGNVDEIYFYLVNKSIPFEELCALYAVADMCLISSLTDGMNLVALEYIACQRDKKGTLLLNK